MTVYGLTSQTSNLEILAAIHYLCSSFINNHFEDKHHFILELWASSYIGRTINTG